MELNNRAVIYIRVSTAQQVDGASLDTQEERCNEWALRNGVLVTRTFREEGVSAKTANRPILQEMLSYINDNQKNLNYLIIYEVDRLSRNMEDFMAITTSLKKYKIELKDPTSSLEGSKSDKFIRYFKAMAAEVDNDVKSERVIDNMKRHAMDGYRMAKAPYGLRNVRDALGKSTVEPVPIIADKLAFLLYEFSKDIYTIKELIVLAREKGLNKPNGKPIDHSYMGKILRQPLYAGMESSTHTNGQIIDSVFEGIISKQVYRQNQLILERRKSNKIESYSINHTDYPLRRFMKCLKCESPLRGSSPTGRGGKRYPKYHCTMCKKASIDSSTLNDKFATMLQEIKPNKLTQGLIKTMIVRVWNEELRSLHKQSMGFQMRIDELEAHKQKATDKVVTDDITKIEKLTIHAKADKEIIDLKKSIEKLNKQMGTKQEAIDYCLNYMDNASQIWMDSSIEMRVTYQAMIFPEGITYDFKENKFGTTKMSALYTLASIKKDPSKSEESLLVIPRGIEPRLPG